MSLSPSFVPLMLDKAVAARASDIHIEPGKEQLRIRFRIDGHLQMYRLFPMSGSAPLMSQLKIMADMDIGEKRLPQDGSFSREHVEIRTSTIPTLYGEKMVLRLLQPQSPFSGMHDLGMKELQLLQVRQWIRQPNGLLLVTGPTGSGKTTTLYTMLRELNTTERNIVTLEDPVEIRMNGINQVQIHEKAGLTFARGLRSILRQDPDVIMIGEVRDQETTEIAVRSALTGHLVMTSLHTADAASAVTRLLDMGMPPYLVASSVTGVVAQRLVRKVCDQCGGLGTGCSHCNESGYLGRIAAFEVLNVDDELQELIVTYPSANQIRHHVRQRGMIFLREHLTSLMHNGDTSLLELQRVVTVDA